MAKLSVFEEKVIGEEPVLKTVDPNSTEFRQALNWYNYSFDVELGKKWISIYLKSKKVSASQIDQFNLNCKYISSSLCATARMITRGTVFPNSLEKNLNDAISLYYYTAEKQETVGRTTQEKNADKLCETVGKIENVLDSFYLSEYVYLKPEIYDILTNDNIKGAQAKIIHDYYSDLLQEVTENNSTEEYSKLSKKQIKNYIKFISDILSDVERKIHNTSAVRKPRKKKEKTADQLVAGLKYKKTDDTYKLVSVDPLNIVGCMVLLLFHTKTKKLFKYEAATASGLSLNGSTLINFSDKISICKSIRKPETILSELLYVTKTGINTKLSTIKSKESIPNGRINKEMVILRCLK